MSRGRGRGRGDTKSFNREQLTALGVGAQDAFPAQVTQPPPLFPLLERRPIPLTPSVETDYLLILKQDFIDHMQLSPSYVKLGLNKNSKEPQQEIEKLVAQLPATKEKFKWGLFPSELRPKILARKARKKVAKADVNVVERLQVLEKLEEKIPDDVNENDIKTEAVDDEDLEDNDVEEIDEEMDDGTDYANNYFDNGENYEDEDDNLDDGPCY